MKTKVRDRPPQKLRAATDGLRHNGELYATFVVGVLLLLLKVFHVIDQETIFAAILVTLMLLAWGNLRDRTRQKANENELARIALMLGDATPRRLFRHRTDATPAMLEDLASARHLVFSGISQRQLADILRQAIESNDTLPWKSVDVFFASDNQGKAYEKTAFQKNLREARKEIAWVLTDPQVSSKVPNLRRVAFFQHKTVVTHSGAMFGHNPGEFEVIYVVHSAVVRDRDTNKGLTIRLAPDRLAREEFDYYVELHRTLSKHGSAYSLGEFTPSTWDLSARQWSEYARHSKALSESARIVADMIKPSDGDSILDLGSGSGDSISTVLDRYPRAKAVLLDGSPQMIRILQGELEGRPGVRYALCHLPSAERSDIDLAEERGLFSFIIVHQSLGELVKSFGSLEGLSSWCHDWLREGGQVLLSAHNGVVETKPPDGWGTDWQDPFRTALVKTLEDLGHGAKLRKAEKQIAKSDIEKAFLAYGFEVADHRQQVIPFDLQEKGRLWQVPAVMDTVVDMSGMDPRELGGTVDSVLRSLPQEERNFMPRTVVFWRFDLNRHPEGNATARIS